MNVQAILPGSPAPAPAGNAKSPQAALAFFGDLLAEAVSNAPAGRTPEVGQAFSPVRVDAEPRGAQRRAAGVFGTVQPDAESKAAPALPLTAGQPATPKDAAPVAAMPKPAPAENPADLVTPQAIGPQLIGPQPIGAREIEPPAMRPQDTARAAAPQQDPPAPAQLQPPLAVIHSASPKTSRGLQVSHAAPAAETPQGPNGPAPAESASGQISSSQPAVPAGGAQAAAALTAPPTLPSADAAEISSPEPDDSGAPARPVGDAAEALRAEPKPARKARPASIPEAHAVAVAPQTAVPVFVPLPQPMLRATAHAADAHADEIARPALAYQPDAGKLAPAAAVEVRIRDTEAQAAPGEVQSATVPAKPAVDNHRAAAKPEPPVSAPEEETKPQQQSNTPHAAPIPSGGAPAIQAADHAAPVSHGANEAGVNAPAAAGAVSSAAVVQPAHSRSQSAPQLQTGAPSEPLHEAAKAQQPQPLRSVSLEFTPDGAQDVKLRLSQRGGDVHISLHSTNAELTGRLRDGVQDLAGALNHAGYDAEAWSSDDRGRRQQQPEQQPQPQRRNAQSGSEDDFSRSLRQSTQENA